MVKDPRKHQKKLERRRAKEKAQRKALAANDPRSMAARIERSAKAPILHCCRTTEALEQGMANVLVSRQLPSGNVAYAMFLLDVYCLGVKSVLFDVVSRTRYDMQTFGKFASKHQLEHLAPEGTRKLIEGAAEYARELGMPADKDYPKALRIFGDIDADSCTDEFEYGKSGKPFFISGPHDSPARCERILRILESRCGPGGYTYVMPTAPSDFGMLED